MSTPGVSLVRLIARLVPEAERDAWVGEWEGELDYYWSAIERQGADTPLARIALLARCLGAIPDALCVRRRHGGDEMLSLLARDLRYALRTLGKRPGFTAVVVLTLALGVGANAAIFSVANAVLLRPLPYPGAERLAVVWGTPTDNDSVKVGTSSSFPDYADIRDAARSFEQLAAYSRERHTLTGSGEPVLVPAAPVTANLFATLGVAPAVGRAILPEEDRPGGTRVVVLSYALWQSHFGGDPSVVGRAVVLNGNPYTVVGVMPKGFQFPRDAQLWVPAGQMDRVGSRGMHSFRIVGRLRPGVAREAAEAEVRTIARGLEAQYPQDNAKRSARVVTLHEATVGEMRPALLVLLAATGAVLLIGCANVANLLLVRAAGREREAAVRAALGAGRGDLVRQWLTESLVLALAGGALGLLVAHWGVAGLIAFAPQSIPRADEIRLDGAVLAFLIGVSVLTGLAFGLVPALHFSRGGTVGEGGVMTGRGAAAASPTRRRLRHALVVSEVALAMVLVVAAGLLIKSFNRLQRVDLGFEPEGLLVAQLRLPPSKFPDADRARIRGLYADVATRAAQIPGVRSTAIALEHPFSPGWTSSFTIAGAPRPRDGEEPESRIRPVSPEYFRTVGAPLLAGRDITARDVEGTPGAVVVNEAFARQHFPGEPLQRVLGRRIDRSAWWAGMPEHWEIVGVAADEHFLGPQAAPDPATYFAFAQFTFKDMYVVLRTAGDPAAAAAPLRRAIAAADPDIAIDNLETMEHALGDWVAAPRFNTSLLALFAGVALLLAALGIYGVLAYAVAERTAEIGVRMALGAPRASVIRLVVGQGMALALAGVAAGTLGALALTRSLDRLLFDVRATDPAVFGAVALLLGTVALVACWVPARRAARVDPVVALRQE